MQKRGAGRGNSADARKGVSFCCAFFRSSFRSPNALRAASSQTPYPSLPRKRESSSIPLLVLSKTQTLRWFVFWFFSAFLFAPVEYLTYEIRNISDLIRLVGVDTHIDPLLLAFGRERRGGRLCPPDCIAEYFDSIAGVFNSHRYRVF